MDGATVAITREGLPDDVIERLQRKVMEQARELSALRKSEAAAQAELDRALLGSPGRARSPSPTSKWSGPLSRTKHARACATTSTTRRHDARHAALGRHGQGDLRPQGPTTGVRLRELLRALPQDGAHHAGLHSKLQATQDADDDEFGNVCS